MKNPKVSVIVPTMGGSYLKFLLESLKNQEISPYEVILVLKDCDINEIKALCKKFKINCKIVEQEEGYFTHALNLGKEAASGDIIIFTDDDAIAPKKWIKRYIELFSKHSKKVGSISSRDVYYDISTGRILRAPDDLIHVRLYRQIIRPILDPPHPLLKKYRLGSYISKRYKFVTGRGIPDKVCYSLPFRGVNMAFRREAIKDISFIEHNGLKRGFRNEQHFGVQLILNGYDSIYYPDNYVYHISRESLSRVDKKLKEVLKREEEIVREEIIRLLKGHKIAESERK